jgi:hypothetical protein
MTPNAPRSNGHGPDTYWRRRVIALAGGLGLLGLLAWACTGAVGRTASGSPAAAPASPARAQQAAVSTARPTPSAKPATTVTARPPARRRPVAAPSRRRPGGGCAPGDLVVSLYASGTSFGPGEAPQFQIDVVNVGSQACTFDSGWRSLRLVIRSAPDRIWSSSDCSHAPASQARRLPRGVPYTPRVTWDLRRSSPGCRATGRAALPGMYTAVAHGGGAASPAAVFTLR